ncbi:MAG: hypothetical protein AAFU80_08060 [Pseudomonadota bacterium]
MNEFVLFMANVTVGDLILAALATALLHEAMILVLPDDIAGPGGWLIDTSARE